MMRVILVSVLMVEVLLTSVVVLYPIQDVIKVHFALLRAIDLNMVSGGNGLGKIFIDFKERLVTSRRFVCVCVCV